MGRSLRDACTPSGGPPVGRREILLVALPLVGVGLGQADVGEDSMDEVLGHLLCTLGVVIEGGDGREDGGSGVGG